MDRRRRFAPLLPVVLLAALSACGQGGDGEQAAQDQSRQEETVARKDIMAVVDEHAPGLIAVPGVEAVAVGALPSGDPCVRIYVAELTDELRGRLPDELGGWPVDVEESGKFRPLDADTGAGDR